MDGPIGSSANAAADGGQFDPIVEVVPNTGHVYAVWMNDFDVFFSKSTDNGATWSAPVKTYGKVSWNDKPSSRRATTASTYTSLGTARIGGDPSRAVARLGRDVDADQAGDSTRYYFAFDAEVLPNGTVVFSESSVEYTGPGRPGGPGRSTRSVRRTRGRAGRNVLVDSLELARLRGRRLLRRLLPRPSAMSADANGNLVYPLRRRNDRGGPQTIWTSRSTDGGATWTTRLALSTAGVNTRSPRWSRDAPATSVPGTRKPTGVTTRGTSVPLVDRRRGYLVERR